MSDSVFVGMNAAGYSDSDVLTPISRVTVFYGEDETEYYTAGNDSGRELSNFCPAATQAMADAMLAVAQNVTYRPFTALVPTSDYG